MSNAIQMSNMIQMYSNCSQPAGVVRRRLWKAGAMLACYILTLIVCNFFDPREKAVTRDMIGHDFLPFYAAGSMAREGHFHDLYDLTAIKLAEQEAARSAGLGVGYGPWWNPPFAAWIFAPFSYLPFSSALIAWEALGLAALGVSLFLLARMLPDAGNWRNWGLVVLLSAASNPLVAVIAHAQNTFMTLLLLTITVTLWRQRQALAAGLVAGLLFYKPQHAAIVGIVLVISLGWRAAAGLLITGCTLLLLTVVTMPGSLGDYLHKLPRLLVVMQELSPYSWDRHVTFKAFWRMLLQGNAPGPTGWLTWSLWGLCEIAAIVLLGITALAARREPGKLDRLIAATILSSPLLVPFCFDYDLMILAIPAVLCAGDAMRSTPPRNNNPLLWAWIILYLVLHISTILASPTRVILAVPALAAVITALAMETSSKSSRQSLPHEQSFPPQQALAA